MLSVYQSLSIFITYYSGCRGYRLFRKGEPYRYSLHILTAGTIKKLIVFVAIGTPGWGRHAYEDYQKLYTDSSFKILKIQLFFFSYTICSIPSDYLLRETKSKALELCLKWDRPSEVVDFHWYTRMRQRCIRGLPKGIYGDFILKFEYSVIFLLLYYLLYVLMLRETNSKALELCLKWDRPSEVVHGARTNALTWEEEKWWN
jgi:hypothetical protein